MTRREQHPVFDAVFKLFWRNADMANFGAVIPMDQISMKRQKPKAAEMRAAAAMEGNRPPRRQDKDEVQLDARLTTSEEEVFRHRDFEQMTASEVAEAERRIAGFRFTGDRMKTRRFMPAPHGRFDARRTLRQSLRSGGKLILPKSRTRREKLPPIVALLDISGSMGSYSRMLLHFLHALGRERRVTTFVFGTRLTNITRQLRTKDVDEALAAASAVVDDWQGGTRISSSLHTFNRLWSRRVLGQGAVVLARDRWSGARVGRQARRGDGPAAPVQPASDLAQPAAALSGLHGARGRGEGHAAERGLVSDDTFAAVDRRPLPDAR